MISGNLNRKQIFLYFLALVLLQFSDIPGGALIALFCFFQTGLLFFEIPFNKSNQWLVTKVFLFLIPLFIFWGGILSLSRAYMKDSHWIFILGSSIVTLAITLFSVILIFSFFHSLRNSQKSELDLPLVRSSFADNKKIFFMAGIVFWFTSQLPLFAADWMIVWSFVILQLVFSRQKLKQVFSV